MTLVRCSCVIRATILARFPRPNSVSDAAELFERFVIGIDERDVLFPGPHEERARRRFSIPERDDECFGIYADRRVLILAVNFHI